MKNIAINIVVIIFVAAFFLTGAAETSDPAIYQVQKALKELGYDPGLLDGLWGEQTTAAVKSFQRDNGLPVTGQLDARTKAMLNSKKPSFRLSLIEAVKENHIITVKALLSAGANVNAKDTFGETLLHLSAVRGYKEMTSVLIAEGADVDAKDERGLTPLHAAAWGGHKEILELFINKNTDINLRSTQGLTPLHMAALSGHKETIETLILKGADVNARSADGMTPLHAAAFGGHKEAVELLLDNGADGGAENDDGQTPLQMASQEGYLAIVRLLRNYEAQNKIVQ